MMSTQAQAALNDAVRVLKDPLRRAAHLLELGGVPVSEKDMVAQDFLMEILELREELDEAKAAQDQTRLASLGEQMHARADGAMHDIAASLAAGRLAEAKDKLIEMRYFQRFLDEHEGKEAF
jgi:molecular chaperone HscB